MLKTKDYRYEWKMTKRHPERRGQPCRVLSHHGHSYAKRVTVEFEDGFVIEDAARSAISMRKVRR